MPEEYHQENNSPKSSDSSEDQPKKVGKNFRTLDKLIASLVICTLGYIGVTFLNCNFMVPGSLERADALGGLVNPPPLDCKESESRAYNALFTLLTALLGLKAKMED
jgi:hypothetical protein